MCIKKAQKVRDFVENSLSVPHGLPRSYVLITDWREAKPCMTLLEQHVCHPPALFVVLCEGDRQASRAHVWIQTLPDIAPLALVVNQQKTFDTTTHALLMNRPVECRSLCILDLCQQLNAACLQWRWLAPACEYVVKNRMICTLATFASCSNQGVPLLGADAHAKTSDSDARSDDDGRQTATPGKTEALRGYELTLKECPDAKTQVLHSQQDVTRSSVLFDSPLTRHNLQTEHDFWLASASPAVVISHIVENHSKQDLEAMLANSSMDYYED